MFQNTRISLRIRYLSCTVFALALLGLTNQALRAEESAPYAEYYNPDSGFKPAQRDFTKIFLQMAGSLEHHGSPEPYIRHVLAEHTRIAAKYKAATGKDDTPRPRYLTDHFVEHLLANWNKLTPSLKLDSLCRQSGRNMRLAIMGTWNMPIAELVAQEAALTGDEKKSLQNLLEKPFFAREDFPSVEAFYADGGGYDKLSESGKSQLSRRVHLGTLTPDKRDAAIKDDKGGSLAVALLNSHHEALIKYLTTNSKEVVNGDTLLATMKSGLKLDQDELDLSELTDYQRDAFQFSHAIKADFEKRYDFVNKNTTNAASAKNMKAALFSMVDNLVAIADSEFRAGLMEIQSGTK
jgi:hypothetical protein